MEIGNRYVDGVTTSLSFLIKLGLETVVRSLSRVGMVRSRPRITPRCQAELPQRRDGLSSPVKYPSVPMPPRERNQETRHPECYYKVRVCKLLPVGKIWLSALFFFF